MGNEPPGTAFESTQSMPGGAAERGRATEHTPRSSVPASIGRYQVKGELGGGGMGVVYNAYDPQLLRNVALKVLHPRRHHDGRSQQRMLLEGQALAKLDHRNVVKVHDVLLDDERVVVVMELLAGETLEHWQDQERTLQEVVAVYAQAAEGLAAAHAVDIVHRDFKPSNVMVGPTGDVRVLDFGLARLSSDSEEVAVGSSPSPASPGLTATGDVLGTLGYSSPEQLAGNRATPASDQFSFCVALHGAVEGRAPFSGATPQDRRASIERGVIDRDARRRVPGWLRALISRGLAADPARRHASISDILQELRRPRGFRRWRTPAIAAGLITAAVIATAFVARPAAEDTCAGPTALDDVWNPATRDLLQGAVAAIGTPYATEVRDQLPRVLDRYADDWRAAHASVCRAHRNGGTSDGVHDRQMVCLSRRVAEVRAATGVLARVEVDSLASSMDVASALTSVSPCTDLAAIASDLDPPADPAVRAQVAALRARISEAEALARSGQSETALEMLAQIRATARTVSYRPLAVEAALSQGRIQLAHHDKAALGSLREAQEGAFAEEMDSAGLEAAARTIYVEGQVAPDLARLEGQLPHVLPLSLRLRRRGDYFTRPLLLNNIGTVYLAAAKTDEARRYFAAAKAEIQLHDPENLELGVIDLNLAMLTADPASRETLARTVWETRQRVLGEHHRSTLDALATYATVASDPRTAFDAMTRAATGYGRFHPSASRPIAVVEAKRALLARELGDLAFAKPVAEHALARLGGDDDEDIRVWRRLAEGELALDQRDPAAAIRALGPVYDARHASAQWWERADALRAAAGLGEAAAQQGDDARAVRFLEEAVAKYPDLFAINEEVEYRRYRARAMRALAMALRRLGRDPDRASRMERDAHEFYRTTGPASYRWILEARCSCEEKGRRDARTPDNEALPNHRHRGAVRDRLWPVARACAGAQGGTRARQSSAGP